MGKAKEQTNIDKVALKKYIQSKGLYLGRVSEMLGFSNNYLSDVLRPGVGKNISLPAYKYLCAILKVSEDKFIIKEEPKVAPKKAEKADVQQNTPIQVNAGMTPEQFNALLQAISGLTDAINKGFEKVSGAQNSEAVIQGKIYGEIVAISDALGVQSTTSTVVDPGKTHSSVSIKSQYQNAFGGKKNV